MLRTGLKADLAIFDGDVLATDPHALAEVPLRCTVLDGLVVHEARAA